MPEEWYECRTPNMVLTSVWDWDLEYDDEVDLDPDMDEI